MKIQMVLLLLVICLAACGPGKDQKIKDAVIYATNALQQASSNPFSRATYENAIARGGNAVDYIKAITPKENPMLEYFQYDTPPKEYTVVIRPGTETNEYFIEGYGRDPKKPIVYDTVTVAVQSQ